MFGKNKLRLSRSQRLLRDAREADELRRYRTHPQVAALGIERIRTAVGVLVWTGLVLGLLFTMSNVQQFAARGAAPWSLPWVIAWFLDPMVSLCLVGVLIAESTLARYQLVAGPWVRGAKWGLLGATFLMNTWASLWNWPLTPAPFLLHAVPPLVVWVMAEAITDLRSKLTDAVVAAHSYASHALTTATDPVHADPAQTIPVTTDPVPAVERAPRSAPGADHATGSGAQSEATATDEDQSAAAPEDRSAGAADGQDHQDHSDQPARTTTRTKNETARSEPRAAGPTDGPDVSDLLTPGRTVQDRVAAQGRRLSRRALIDGLREDGHTVSTTRANALLKLLNAEPTSAPTEDPTRSDAQRASEAA